MSTLDSNQLKRTSALKIVTSTLGALVGLAGIEHGILELFQGNVVPTDYTIDAIGPDQRFWEGAKETAFTIIPNLFLTGILAIIVGIIVTVWSVKYIDGKYGSRGFFILNLSLFFVGGGFAPPTTFGIVATITATGINKPHNWWKSKLPISLQKNLIKLWPSILIGFVLLFVLTVALNIFGWPLVPLFGNINTAAIIWTLAFIMIVMMIVAVLTGISYDIDRENSEF